MVGRPSFPFGIPSSQVRTVSFREFRMVYIYCSSLSPFPFISFGAAISNATKGATSVSLGRPIVGDKKVQVRRFCWCEGSVPYHQATLESMVDGWSSGVFLPPLIGGIFGRLGPWRSIRSNRDSARFRYVSTSHLEGVDPWCTNKFWLISNVWKQVHHVSGWWFKCIFF